MVHRGGVITSIARQKNKTNRASIFLDNEFSFGVNDQTVEQFRLRKGDELTSDLIEEIQAFDDNVSAKRVAIAYLNSRRRSEREVEKKLAGKKFAPEVIEKVITFLKEAALLNDTELAEAFIHDKLLTKAASKRELENLLYKKGISKTIIANVLEGHGGDESELALKAAEKKWPTLLRKESDPRKRSQKLYAFLASRGFNQTTTKETIKKFSESGSEFSEFENE